MSQSAHEKSKLHVSTSLESDSMELFAIQQPLRFQTAQGSNNSAIISTIMELVNVTMRGKLFAAHEKSSFEAEESQMH